MKKCQVAGCKNEAKWACRKLFGKRDTLCLCDSCKPDADKRPPALRHLPFFYEVRPLSPS